MFIFSSWESDFYGYWIYDWILKVSSQPDEMTRLSINWIDIVLVCGFQGGVGG